MAHPRPCARLVLIGLAFAASATSFARPQAPARPDLPALLANAADYVKTFEREFFGAVAEERYEQTVRSQGVVVAGINNTVRTRRFTSEVALLAFPDVGWVGFRDIIAVDGRSVVDRADRLTKLFQAGNKDLLTQGQALADEGSRFNLGSVQRNLNHPSLALIYLSGPWQSRSTFTLDDRARVNGTAAWIVKFTEHARPSTVRSGESHHDVETWGRYWIEPESGRVLRSELRLRVDFVSAELTTTYVAQPKFAVLVPASLQERYDAGRQEVIEGTASYRNFRTFNIDTNTIIK